MESYQGKNIQHFKELLCNEKTKLGDKYIAMFELKNFNNEEALQYLMEDSELLRHDLCYTLGTINLIYKYQKGQMKFNQKVLNFLINIVNDEKEKAVTRHEAGEAIANFGLIETLPILEKYLDSPIEPLKHTCMLAVGKLKNFNCHKNKYGIQFNGTKEPGAPFSEQEIQTEIFNEKIIKKDEQFYIKIAEYIMNEKTDFYDKYRALYYLRDQQGTNNFNLKYLLKSLCLLLISQNREKTSLLLRHEVCFVLGQIGNQAKEAEGTLNQLLEDLNEHEIVRHEAAIALSSITSDKTMLQFQKLKKQLLIQRKKYLTDEHRIVRESCETALHLVDYWNSKE